MNIGSNLIPQMPPYYYPPVLPQALCHHGHVRVSRSDPFQFVVLDYFGAVFVKGKGGLDKVWICLFNYLNVRAIHLEWGTEQF